MLPRAAVREVEQRLTAAGCPDADFDARELFRLATGRDAVSYTHLFPWLI